MSRCHFSPRARLDLLEIHAYIARSNPDAAARFIDTLEETCLMLAKSPALGQKCEEIQPSLRFFTVRNYVIYYRPRNEGIEIVRVVHGARDIRSLF